MSIFSTVIDQTVKRHGIDCTLITGQGVFQVKIARRGFAEADVNTGTPIEQVKDRWVFSKTLLDSAGASEKPRKGDKFTIYDLGAYTIKTCSARIALNEVIGYDITTEGA